MSRTANIDRKTSETELPSQTWPGRHRSHRNLDPVPFMDHMLTHIARHGFFDLTVKGSGDIEIDDHHTVEDLGICLGKAFRMALADKAGIRRYGSGRMPMHEALVSVDIDFSGRPFLVYNVDIPKTKVGNFDVELVEEFFVAFCNHAGANLHVNLHYGEQPAPHHRSDFQGPRPGAGRCDPARSAHPGGAFDQGIAGTRNRMITIIDYGMGNLRSVQKGFETRRPRRAGERRSRGPWKRPNARPARRRRLSRLHPQSARRRVRRADPAPCGFGTSVSRHLPRPADAVQRKRGVRPASGAGDHSRQGGAFSGRHGAERRRAQGAAHGMEQHRDSPPVPPFTGDRRRQLRLFRPFLLCRP